MLPKINALLCVSSVTAVCLLSSCIPPPKYVDLTQKDKVAVVSFTLDKTIKAQSDSEPDRGPGLLPKLVKGSKKAENDYFKYHQEALEGMWGQFKENIQEALLGIPMVSFDEITSNEKYRTATAHKEKKILGTDYAEGHSRLNPEGLNYVNHYDTAMMNSVCDIVGCDLLLTVDNVANFEDVPPPISSGSDGSITITPVAKSRIILTTTLALYEKGNGTVFIHDFTAKSDDKMLVIWTNSTPEEYPQLMMQANAKIFSEIKTEFLRQKEKYAEQAAAQAAETAK
ncbi:MAG: hypothetical protein Q4F84_00430 [Fibrobacter sp.]|nr:hypothetical protein [Fibrobacter sp.]